MRECHLVKVPISKHIVQMSCWRGVRNTLSLVYIKTDLTRRGESKHYHHAMNSPRASICTSISGEQLIQ